MTRYRLPDALGGGEYEEEPITGAIASCKGFVIDGHTVAIHVALLTAVAAPLPPEPPVGTIAQVGAALYQRRSTTGLDWVNLRTDAWMTWQSLCERAGPGEPVIFVPDPKARPRSCPTCHSPVQVSLGPFDDQRCADGWHD